LSPAVKTLCPLRENKKDPVLFRTAIDNGLCQEQEFQLFESFEVAVGGDEGAAVDESRGGDEAINKRRLKPVIFKIAADETRAPERVIRGGKAREAGKEREHSYFLIRVHALNKFGDDHATEENFVSAIEFFDALPDTACALIICAAGVFEQGRRVKEIGHTSCFRVR
jgi:hypothetical protein